MAKFVDKTETREFTDEDGDVLVLRTALSKGESDRISELRQNYRMSPQAAAGVPDEDETVEIRSRIREINREIFVMLAKSLTIGHESQDISADTYAELDEDSGNWVDTCISDVLRERRERRAEGNASPTSPTDSPGTPPAESASTGPSSTTTSDE